MICLEQIIWNQPPVLILVRVTYIPRKIQARKPQTPTHIPTNASFQVYNTLLTNHCSPQHPSHLPHHHNFCTHVAPASLTTTSWHRLHPNYLVPTSPSPLAVSLGALSLQMDNLSSIVYMEKASLERMWTMLAMMGEAEGHSKKQS